MASSCKAQKIRLVVSQTENQKDNIMEIGFSARVYGTLLAPSSRRMQKQTEHEIQNDMEPCL